MPQLDKIIRPSLKPLRNIYHTGIIEVMPYIIWSSNVIIYTYTISLYGHRQY